ncbi:MAG TPA: suppressor of fused domain protein [Mycobacterium sp.]|nr:suppressor of fused domain protein [Mycobacterium sp.]
MTRVLEEVRAHLRGHFTGRGIDREPDSASVTFLGVERVEVLRFGPDPDGVLHYVSLGCSRHPMGDAAAVAVDPLRGPRAEVVVALHDSVPTPGLARTVALLAATPAVDGLVLVPDALIDVGAPLWERPAGLPPFSAVVLGPSGIGDVALDPPRDPVTFLAATPITANEAAWVRLKGVDALRETWRQAGIDVTDPQRVGSQPT